MNRAAVAGFLSRLAALIPSHVPDMTDPDVLADLVQRWGNVALFDLEVDEAADVADELAERWGLPRWPQPADFSDALRRRRNRHAKDAALAASRDAIRNAPPSALDTPWR